MTKEEYLKGLILQRWTLKDFAAKINMPYGTLYSILKNVDGGSMYNIVKICSGLHISTNELSQIEKPRNYILQEARSTNSTKELPDLRSILSSTFLFNGTKYTLSEEKQDMLSQIIHSSCTERKNTVAPASYFSWQITALPAYLIQTGRRKHT